MGALLLAPLMTLVLASTAVAEPPVLLGTADNFAVLGGSTITNTGPTVINGDLGLHPGTAVTGFPPGTVNGTMHVTDAVALQAKNDLTTAYGDAAGRPFSATVPPDVGGLTLTTGVYRTGSVPALQLTGNLTLDAQGDPNAVFIFQVASTLTTATDSSVSLVNGAQACNVYWQVGSSATLGTRTAFRGNILALTSISVNDAVTVDGRLLARNAAVTMINDTVTRARCATTPGPAPTPTPTPTPSPTPDPGTGAGVAPGAGAGAGPGAGAAPGTVAARPPRPDVTRPQVQITGPPGVRKPPVHRPGAPAPPARTVCTTRDFTLKVRVRDPSGIRSVSVYLDGRLVKRTSRPGFSLRVEIRGLRVGRHQIRVVARDRAGNQTVTTRNFGRCALALTVPQFTG